MGIVPGTLEAASDSRKTEDTEENQKKTQEENLTLLVLAWAFFLLQKWLIVSTTEWALLFAGLLEMWQITLIFTIFFFRVYKVIPGHAKARKMFICFVFWSSLITLCFSAVYLNVEVIHGPLYYHYFLCLEFETVPSAQVNYKYFVIVVI